MWAKKKIALPASVRQALADNQKGRATPLNFTLTGVKIGVHNWSHGVQEKSNKYLSPENAVKAFFSKLTDYNDTNRPSGTQDVICVMVASPTSDDFVQKISALAELLPEPTFKQALDYAKASATIEQTKMVKTTALASPAFAKEADITPQSARTLQGVMRNALATASATASSGMSDIINALKAKKVERDRKNNEKTDRLLSASAETYVFEMQAELTQVAMQLQNGVPDASNVFTAAVMFIGKDLTNLRGMINGLD